MNVDKSKLTPMMQQYCSIKEQHIDCLVFYRLGDFYELFFDDAVVGSKELGLVLTHRNDIPMCGVPWHAHEMYLTKLVQNGHRIAICEQTETPEEAKKRGYKALVERKVTRIITKGTIIEQSLLWDKNNNFLLSISGDDSILGVAYTDVSTGRFFLEEVKPEDLLSVISKISPSEIICPDSMLSKKEFLNSFEKYKSIIRALPSSKFMKDSSNERLAKFFNVKFVDSFGNFSKCVIDAAAAIVEYISSVYIESEVSLLPPKMIRNDEYMHLDSFTRRSLELEITQSGDKNGSLLNCIDKTLTSQGARMLGRWLKEPLLDISKINKRLSYVEFFVKNQNVLQKIREILKDAPDIERSISRILMGKGGPRDLKCISTCLQKAKEFGDFVSQFDELKNLIFKNESTEKLINLLNSALCDSPPLLARDGGFIKKNYDEELDEYLLFLNNGNSIIQGLQKSYINETGIATLKIKNNGILGYFIDVSPSYVSKIPYNFIHRQTLATSVRYTTQEIIEIAEKIYSAELNVKRREFAIFEDLVSKISKEQKIIRNISDSISFLDVVSSFACLSIENNYVKPIFTNDKTFDIKNGRHPVVEDMLKKEGIKFIANNCKCDDINYISLLTGPNMGGKSTYLRQNAIIAIMAQIGSFVPADSAKIGIIDRIFSRVGASDDISSGRSTFMVEMIETAAILNQASEKSFIILDEIGRGTSTYDGLAIAWAVVEEISNNIKARTIFATHYHELKDLKNTVSDIKFLTVKVEEWNNNIVFLHEIVEGFADKSYGIHVAALAGFPKKVLQRASEILTTQK